MNTYRRGLSPLLVVYSQPGSTVTYLPGEFAYLGDRNRQSAVRDKSEQGKYVRPVASSLVALVSTVCTGCHGFAPSCLSRGKETTPAGLVDVDRSYRARERAHRPLCEYSLRNCLAHALYAPCWLAGPTISFNAFVSHFSQAEPGGPQRSFGARDLLVYFGRLFFCLALLDVVLHLAPVFGIGRSRIFYELQG